MTTMQEAFKAVLAGDATLSALATGGILDADDVGRRGLTRADIAAAGTVVIDPVIYINWTTDDPFGVRQAVLGARRVFVEVYFYQDSGYSTVTAMRQRVRSLLEYAPVQFTEPANQWMADILWRGDILQMKDESLGDVSMERTRYEVLVTPVAVEA